MQENDGLARTACVDVMQPDARQVGEAAFGSLRAGGRHGQQRQKGERGGNVAGAKAIGRAIAQRLLDKGVKQVVFDRNGFLYHGRVKAVADAAREAGLEF